MPTIEETGATAAANAQPKGGKYLTFGLGSEEFGVAVLHVREIMGIQDVTSVPQTPHFVKGVLNLRGKVIPVIDLRLKFGLPEKEYTQRTCIIVAQLHQGIANRLIGIIVDGVSEVLTIQADDVEDTPDFGNGVEIPYILGMAKIKGKVKILLNMNQVLTSGELEGLDRIAD